MWHKRKIRDKELKSFLAKTFPEGPPSSLIVTAWGQAIDKSVKVGIWDYGPCFMVIWYEQSFKL